MNHYLLKHLYQNDIVNPRSVRFLIRTMNSILERRHKVTVLYATESGRSEAFAYKLGDVMKTAFDVRVTKGRVTNYREGEGLQNGRGACEVLLIRKGGRAEKVLATLKAGHKKFWGSFSAVP